MSLKSSAVLKGESYEIADPISSAEGGSCLSIHFCSLNTWHKLIIYVLLIQDPNMQFTLHYVYIHLCFPSGLCNQTLFAPLRSGVSGAICP